MIAIVTGLIASYPLGGMTFHYLQYMLGLRALGWQVVYLEDTGKWVYDPARGTFSDDCSSNVRYLRDVMDAHGFGQSWCFRGPDDRLSGPLASDLADLVRRADLLLNISGSCWLRPEYRRCKILVYLDTDPGYTQFKIAQAASVDGDSDLRYSADRIAEHDFHATFGENIGREGCTVPPGPFRWIPTRQPVDCRLWPVRRHRGPVRFSTILSWTPYKDPIRYGGDEFWGKERELEKVISLPQITGATFELAVSGRTPESRLRAHGWDLRPAVPISNTPAAYRDYITASAAEFTVAKDVYVTTRSGWFSERTACYLASGRPAVVQNTGFRSHMPTGAGILAYDDLEGAADGVRRVVADYALHSAAARRIAEQHFNPKRILTDLLASVGAR